MVTKYDTLNYLIAPSYVCFGQEELTGDLNEHLKNDTRRKFIPKKD